MRGFEKYPFVFLTSSLVLGVVLSPFFGNSWWVVILLLVPFFFLKIKVLHRFLAVCICFCLGIFLGTKLIRNQQEAALNHFTKDTFCKAEILEIKHWVGENRILLKIKNSENKTLINKNIFITIDTIYRPEIGDEIVFSGDIVPFRKPTIPNQFDFAVYYRNQNTVAQSYLSSKQILRTAQHKNWRFYIQKMRDYLESNLEKTLAPSDERAIIKALVTGEREDIDWELKNTYVTAGIFHVLAVSGSHVAVIFVILLFFSRKLNNKYLRVSFLLVSLMLYACLTGLSQSVVRAVAMFSLLGIALVLNKKTSAINTLFGASFLIFILEPGYIYESGFQLSACAVLGILIFYKPIENGLKVKNKFLRKIWSFSSVSIAAQVFTTPLVLYYFHQFPTYFLFINVLVVILVEAILVFGLLAACIGTFCGIGTLLGKIAYFICLIVNKLSILTSNLPYSKIGGLHISEWQVFLLFLAMFLGYWYYQYKTRILFYMTFVSLLIISITITYRFFEYKDQHYLAFHKLKSELIIEHVQGRTSKLYFDNKRLNYNDLQVAFGNYWAKRNISQIKENNCDFPLIINGLILDNKNKPDILVEKERRKFKVFQKNKILSSENWHMSNIINFSKR